MALGKFKAQNFSTAAPAAGGVIQSLNGLVALTLVYDGSGVTSATFNAQTQNMSGTWVDAGAPVSLAAAGSGSVSYPSTCAAFRAARINVTAVAGGTLNAEIRCFET